jgi:two-component system, response regulator PdtaR
MGSVGNRTLCVVVVDDGLLRLDAVLLLEEAGFEVRQFVSVDKALAYLETKAAGVILVFTDVHTPGSLDGVALAQVACERWPWIKTLITSGTISTVVDRIPAGSTFMRKPWRASEVLAQAAMAAQHASHAE